MKRSLPLAALARRLAVVLAGMSLLTGPSAATGDPFQPGLRWVHGAQPSAPWLPASVSFAAGGELVWASGFPGGARLMVLAAPGEGVVAPLFEDAVLGPVTGALSVCAAESPERLFSLAQYDVAGGAARSTQ
ncbi:MAG: hypothetical protein QF410_16360, partial [Planctomycetota bacterium]|nr:hypothetical protein [Planctomycetota bacterium]